MWARRKGRGSGGDAGEPGDAGCAACSGVSACGGAAGRQEVRRPRVPGRRWKAARAPRPACHPPGAVEAAGGRAGLFRTRSRKTLRSVSREAVHARLHPSRGLERCTAALHAEWMRAEYHRSGRGGARVGNRPNWPAQRVEKVRIETQTVCPESADPVGASVSGRGLGYSPAGSAPCVADCAAAARRRDSSSAASRRASSSSRLASAASRRLRARPISIAAMMPLS